MSALGRPKWMIRDSVRDERGAMAILIAILMVVLVGLTSIVVDIGVARLKRADALNVAGFAALAGGQDLPREDAALATVADYLTRNWCPADTGDWDSELCPVTVERLTDDDVDRPNGEVVFGAEAWPDCASSCMRVTTPESRVPFALAGALPDAADSVSVTASATVEIRSPADVEWPLTLPVLPLMATSSVASGTACFELRPTPPAAPVPPPPGDPTPVENCTPYRPYGLFNYGRSDSGPSDWLRFNIAKSIQQPPPIVIGSRIRPLDDSNRTEWGDGLIGPPSTCAGRLGDPNGPLRVNTCDVVGDSWNGHLAADDPRPGISNRIISDPRFGVVPVVNELPSPGGQARVVDFVGAYIRDLYVATDADGNPDSPPVVRLCTSAAPCVGELASATVEFFDLNDINDILLPNDRESVPYVSGPKMVVPVE